MCIGPPSLFHAMGIGKHHSPGTSPLLQRAREADKLGGVPRRLRVPRRGRIRLVLMLVALLVAWRVYDRDRADDPTVSDETGDTASVATADTAAAAPVAQAPSSAPAQKPPPTAAGKQHKARHASMSFEDVTRLMRGRSPRFDSPRDVIRADGRSLAVHYSIDTALQSYGRKLLRRYHPKYGAVAMIECASGRVLSLVSYVNDGEPFLGHDLYCRSYFPAASIFKIITAAGAIEKGRLTPRSEMRQVGRNHTLYTFQLEPSLKNYRTISLAKSFAYSINPVFGRIGIYVLGEEGLREYSERFGFEQTVPFELPVDTAHVGSYDSTFGQAEVASGFNQQTLLSPLLGALIASAASEGGRIPRPHVVDSIIDRKRGAKTYEAERRLWKVAVRQSTAEHLAEMMQNVVRYGTARTSFRYVKRSHRFSGLAYGGKTGSVDKDGVGRVDWFVGFVRSNTDERKRLAIGVVTVHGPYWTVHSSFVAAEMLRHYMRELEQRDEQQAVALRASQAEEGNDG
ncbi:MAG: hypothetical protein GF331_15975 [Chitinivibrionales bacterium]|nr:hypothetical protein [Chitinivibrionales bacterium]